jgi:hypothetical protein
MGPAGTTLRAAVAPDGQLVAGNAVATTHNAGGNLYQVRLGRPTRGCVATATLAGVGNNSPDPGRITLYVTDDGVGVGTYGADGAPVEAPFHLMVAC